MYSVERLKVNRPQMKKRLRVMLFWSNTKNQQWCILIQLMLNPIKNLRGKINHLCFPSTHLFRIIQLANSITPNSQATVFSSTSLEDIQALKSDTTHICPRIFHKFEFDLMVHTDNAVYSSPSTVFDQLNPHERKISYAVTKYTSNLSPKQMLYLNLILRHKINNEYPNWNTLHLSPEAPFKNQIEVLPSLLANSRLWELKTLKKKGVMKEVVKAKHTQ